MKFGAIVPTKSLNLELGQVKAAATFDYPGYPGITKKNLIHGATRGEWSITNLQQTHEKLVLNTPIPIAPDYFWGEETAPLGALMQQAGGGSDSPKALIAKLENNPQDPQFLALDLTQNGQINPYNAHKIENASGRATKILAGNLLNERVASIKLNAGPHSVTLETVAARNGVESFNGNPPDILKYQVSMLDPSARGPGADRFSWSKVAGDSMSGRPIWRKQVNSLINGAASQLAKDLRGTKDNFAEKVADAVEQTIREQNQWVAGLEFVNKFNALKTREKRWDFYMAELNKHYPPKEEAGQNVPKDHPLEIHSLRSYVWDELRWNWSGAVEAYMSRKVPNYQYEPGID